MFTIRSASPNDIQDLLALSKIQNFINLPPDEEQLNFLVNQSQKSFLKPSKDYSKNFFLFVLEDSSSDKIIGTSMIHAQHGTENEPHFYLKVTQEYKFSTSINTGFVHGRLNLGLDTDGPTEIGGLILHPSYRNNPYKLGKQLSFVRFLYMCFHEHLFKEEIHSELMPPFDENGNSPLWEAIGRKFLNMNYNDADKLSRKNKEFILSLFPSDNIYVTLLPLEARNAIGKVGRTTLPVKKMLESIGFKYNAEVDPFDGGPHFRCKLKDLKPYKDKFSGEVTCLDFDEKSSAYALLTFKDKNSPFSAKMCKAYVRDNKIVIDTEDFNKYFSKNSQSQLIYL